MFTNYCIPFNIIFESSVVHVLKIAKDAFQSLLVFTLHLDMTSGYNEDFAATIKELSHKKYNYTFNPIERVTI